MSLVAISYNHVFGINNNIENNVFFIDEGMVMFSSGKHIVAYNVDHKVQRFFPICDEGQIDYVVQSYDKALIVIIESLPGKILLHLFDVLNLRSTISYEMKTDKEQKLDIVYASFSDENDFIFIQTGKPDWTLFYYSFKISKIIATDNTCPEENGIVKEVIPNYYDDNSKNKEFSILGGHHINIYEYGNLIKKVYSYKKLSQREVYCCHDWVGPDKIAAGTSYGRILIYDKFAIIHIIYYNDLKEELKLSSNELENNSIKDEENNINETLEKGKSSEHSANIINLDSKTMDDPDYHPEDDIIPNSEINLLGLDNEDRIDIIESNSTGFYVSGSDGIFSNIQYITEENNESSNICQLIQSFTLPSPNTRIRALSLSKYREFMFVLTDKNQFLKLNTELGSTENNKFIPVTPLYHVGPIISIDICARKPIIASCGTDRCVKLWNYFTGECELNKYFQENVYSVALHPSGLFILIGTSDKLRLMSILIDDIRTIKEFYIKNCNECKFCFGGHIFAATNGTTIQLFSTWTYKCLGILKGHNGKINSLYWTQNDDILVSAGSDGAVYVWNVREMKRVSEYVCKDNSYNSAICNRDGSVVWVSGNNCLFQEIMGAQVTRKLNYRVTFKKINISYSGRMLFGGTDKGDIIPLRYPLISDTSEFYRYSAHSDSVTSLGLTYDSQLLISAGKDGCIFIYNVIDKDENGPRIQSRIQFSNEVLITRSDLEEQNIDIEELSRSIEELKLEHEYQMKLKDMNFNDNLKETVEKYSREIEELKNATVQMKGEKEKTEILQEDQWCDTKQKNHANLQELETKYTKQLIKQYDKYNKLKKKSVELEKYWGEKIINAKKDEQDILMKYTQSLEIKISKKSKEILKLKTQLQNNEIECNEFRKMTEEDIDTEIVTLNKKYQTELKTIIDKGFKLKGENGIMKKKFISLNKEIEDSKKDIDDLNKSIENLNSEIKIYEKELLLLKKDMIDRNYLMRDVEKKVFVIKRKNQELEKEKFVLNYNINQLRQEVEPREIKMEQLKKNIAKKNNDLFLINEEKKKLESTIEKLKKNIETQKEIYNKKHKQNSDLHVYFGRMVSDLSNVILHIQEPNVFKKAVQILYKSYCKPSEYDNSYNDVSPEVTSEHYSHMSVLKKRINNLIKENQEAVHTIREEHGPLLQANNEIISQINKLREIDGLSNKHTLKSKTILMKNKRERKRLKQKGAIKKIITFKAQVKKDENENSPNLNIINNPLPEQQQQLIKTT